MVKKFKITEENIYNFDKKKFLIGVEVILIYVITYKELKNDEIISASQDSNKK